MRVLLICLLLFLPVAPVSAQAIQWEPSNGPNGVTVLTLFADSAGVVFASSDALFRSEDRGGSWTQVLDEFAYDVERLPGGGYLAGSSRFTFRSGDGVTWEQLEGREGAHSLYRDGEAVYAGGFQGQLFVSRDTARTWTLLNQSAIDAGARGQVDAIWARGDTILYKEVPNGLHRSIDGGETWRVAPDTFLTFLVPGGEDTLYTNLDAKLTRIVSGTTWEPLIDLPNFGGGVEDAVVSGGVVLATIFGPYLWRGPGREWEEAVAGLESVEVYSAAADPDGFIYVGTRCCVQRSSQPLISTAAEEEERAGLAVAVSPNPVWDRGAVALTLEQAGPVRVELFDLLGRRVRVVHDGPLPSGTSRLSLRAEGLAGGTYVVRVVHGVQTWSRIVTVLR